MDHIREAEQKKSWEMKWGDRNLGKTKVPNKYSDENAVMFQPMNDNSV